MARAPKAPSALVGLTVVVLACGGDDEAYAPKPAFFAVQQRLAE